MGQDDVRVTVRPLGLDEFEAWRTLRLRALHDHPDAFGASYEDEATTGSAARRQRFEASARGEGSAIFGAFDGDTMVGIGGVIRSGGRKDAHRATMWGMYVAPEARGRGAGHGLVNAVVETARGWGCAQVHLTVVAGNGPAERLYRRTGFEAYGVDPRALYVDGRFLDELLMVRFL
ncbi:MAG: N-acetyltransferase family protein [Chloroflexota bacterium]|jgi:GNAT superfamily N-acetyltransferase|nr:GNAT family N-acetyltransferase [Chloroflexota bacterium]NCA14426.1 GNAT family N-acetyltransferase [Pseudomonadota bacterium]